VTKRDRIATRDDWSPRFGFQAASNRGEQVVGRPHIASRVKIPIGTEGANALFHTFADLTDGLEHFAIAFDQRAATQPPLVRIHSECITGDVFGSLRCDCGHQLREAIDRLRVEGGYLLYLRQEGRGIGLNAKLAAYLLQDDGLDTFAANAALGLPEDARSFAPAVEMLNALRVTSVRLLTNNPEKVAQLREGGIEIAEVIETAIYATKHNRRYLDAKRDKKSHSLSRLDQTADSA